MSEFPVNLAFDIDAWAGRAVGCYHEYQPELVGVFDPHDCRAVRIIRAFHQCMGEDPPEPDACELAVIPIRRRFAEVFDPALCEPLQRPLPDNMFRTWLQSAGRAYIFEIPKMEHVT